jgi:hypothetical protein
MNCLSLFPPLWLCDKRPFLVEVVGEAVRQPSLQPLERLGSLAFVSLEAVEVVPYLDGPWVVVALSVAELPHCFHFFGKAAVPCHSLLLVEGFEIGFAEKSAYSPSGERMEALV